MPPEIAKAVEAATEEWEQWGKSIQNCISGQVSPEGSFLTEAEDDRARYIMETYVAPVPRTTATFETVKRNRYAWSGVAISYFVMRAGFDLKPRLRSRPPPTAEEYRDWVASTAAGEFPFSQRHSDFIRWAIRARRDSVEAASYWGYRVDEDEAVPAIGDVIAYGGHGDRRLTDEQRLAYFEKTGNYSGHSDLVVARRPGEVDVIGGNVRQSVTKKTLALDGRWRLADANYPWFVVMKHRP